MKNLILVSLILLALHSCGTRSNIAAVPEDNVNDKIVLVFEKMRPNGSFSLPNGGSMSHGNYPAFSYIGENGFPVCLTVAECQDTMYLSAIDGYLEVAVQYKGVQLDYYLLKGGDTVTFTCDSAGHPIARGTLSPELTRMYNFAQNVQGSRHLFGLLPEKSYHPLISKNNKENLKSHLQYLRNYRQAIDSAAAVGLLDSAYLAYYELQYEFAEQEYRICSAKVEEGKEICAEVRQSDDRYTGYVSYFFTRPNQTFEDVLRDTLMPEKTRKLTLFSHLRVCNLPMMRARMGDVKVKSCYDLYADATGDTVAFSVLEKEFGPLNTVPRSVSMGKTILLDRDNNEKTLETLVNELKGKVIYVDFWASWCGPCVSGMPDALELRKEYAGKDVVFVYLAMSDGFKAWKEAVATHRTAEEGGINYFIANSDTSDIVRDLKIELIPRYIIIDRSGKIVDANAPRPSDKAKIREILDGLLELVF